MRAVGSPVFSLRRMYVCARMNFLRWVRLEQQPCARLKEKELVTVGVDMSMISVCSEESVSS